ncbi:hypothetical protein B0H13DRAFT_1883569 [Mycena leptocephala]|nr:hypothetical protein B0H13DRAFT_1883569 [Mycena leptocephala]
MSEKCPEDASNEKKSKEKQKELILHAYLQSGDFMHDADHDAAHRTRSQYIDDSAEVDHDTLMCKDGSDNDNDSYEAQLHRQDREDFDMAAIDAGHEERLLLLAATNSTTTFPHDHRAQSLPGLPPPNLVLAPPRPSTSRPKMICLRSRRPSYPSPSVTRPPSFCPARAVLPHTPSTSATRCHSFCPACGPTPYDFEFRAETPTFFPPLVGPKRRVESGADTEDSAHRRRLHRFLDVSAEDSDEEDEDEETLSDKEFLDDEPVHDHRQGRRPIFPEEEETEDDLRALAAAYEDAGREYTRAAQEERSVAPMCPVPVSTASAPPVVAQDTIMPDTWVIPRRGLHKGLLSLVLTKRKFLTAPVSTSMTVGLGLMGHQEYNKCIEVSLAADMLSKNFTPVQPTPNQLAAFLADDHPALQKLRFRGPSPALAEGDRVVVVHGPHQGETGFIIVLCEVPVSGQHVKYAKILKDYNGVDILKKGDAGLYVRVADLQRHGLNVPSAIVVQDRVRVVSGVLYRGISGRVIDNSQGFLTIAASSNSEIISATTTSQISDRQIFHISLRYVNRDFRCGNLVRVRRGKHQDHVSLIMATFTGGSIEVFDGDKPKPEQTEFPDHVFKVRAADVDFATFDERESGLTMEHAGISSYTPSSHVAALKPLMRDEAAEQKAAAKVESAKRSLPPCCQLGRLEAKAERTEKENPGKACTKAFRGQSLVTTTMRLALAGWPKKRRKGEDSWHDEDQDGIVITIRSETGHSTVDVTVDKCLHRYTSLPLTKARFLPRDVLMGHVAPRQKGYLQGALPAPKTPPPVRTPSPPSSNEPLWAAIPETPLAGEDNGEWMCVPGLNGKHFDVQVVGITGVKERVSNTLQQLEGRFGHILATAAIDLGAKKVEVCGVGKSGTKHTVHVQCIKLHRKNDSGRLITEVAERVVVIGPYMVGGTTLMGCYGLIQPDILHYYEAGVVCVLVECLDGSFDPNFFKASSLCLAKNVALTYQNQEFVATTFPP